MPICTKTAKTQGISTPKPNIRNIIGRCVGVLGAWVWCLVLGSWFPPIVDGGRNAIQRTARVVDLVKDPGALKCSTTSSAVIRSLKPEA
jgi:hypothetical protein